MAQVVQLRRRLRHRTELPSAEGVGVRSFHGEGDIAAWLVLRRQAFADQSPAIRPWREDDFRTQLSRKRWFSPAHLWFAEVRPSNEGHAGTVATVTLAMRGPPGSAVAAIHWLAVLPQWRRRGIGRLLIATLERRCWDLGHREICLESHVQWTAALRFYEALGYEKDLCLLL